MKIPLTCLLLLVWGSALALNQFEYHDYCIIGAGPAGLQTAYFLHKATRDYIIYEKSSHAGKFLRRQTSLIAVGHRFVLYEFSPASATDQLE